MKGKVHLYKSTWDIISVIQSYKEIICSVKIFKYEEMHEDINFLASDVCDSFELKSYMMDVSILSMLLLTIIGSEQLINFSVDYYDENFIIHYYQTNKKKSRLRR